MQEADYKKTKQNLRILYGSLGICLLLVIVVFLRFTIKTDNPDLSVQTLTEHLDRSQTLYLKFENTHYTLPAGAQVTALFRDLQKTNDRPEENTPWITVHFGELYEFYIYADGIVVGFDGYARSGTKSSAYYQADSTLYTQLTEQLRIHGMVCADNIGFFR